MTTTINITGDSNASNLVLDSNSSSVNGNASESTSTVNEYNAFMGSYPVNSLSGETIVIVHGAGTGATGLGGFAE